MDVLSTTPGRLQEMLASFGGGRVNQPLAPGKWSPREIVTHLADCEIAHAWRYRQALAEDNPVVQPWDQEKWAKHYAAYGAEQALRAFTALREWNLALLRVVTAEQMARPVKHPERGDLTLRELVETAAGHDVNHLRQLEAALKQAA
ncbi:MAG TPA: DinB family protein [Terriglobales bacterium]